MVMRVSTVSQPKKVGRIDSNIKEGVLCVKTRVGKTPRVAGKNNGRHAKHVAHLTYLLVLYIKDIYCNNCPTVNLPNARIILILHVFNFDFNFEFI